MRLTLPLVSVASGLLAPLAVLACLGACTDTTSDKGKADAGPILDGGDASTGKDAMVDAAMPNPADSDDAASEADADGTTGANGTGGAGGSSAGDASMPADQGDLQHCVFDAGCLEFRMHRSGCWESNELNCQNIFDGTYGVGACPDIEYQEMHPTQTSCGLTVDLRK